MEIGTGSVTTYLFGSGARFDSASVALCIACRFVLECEHVNRKTLSVRQTPEGTASVLRDTSARDSICQSPNCVKQRGRFLFEEMSKCRSLTLRAVKQGRF